jgi:hypothetical protein
LRKARERFHDAPTAPLDPRQHFRQPIGDLADRWRDAERLGEGTDHLVEHQDRPILGAIAWVHAP